jgi:cysteine desulfurase/selenocysteine lyase
MPPFFGGGEMIKRVELRSFTTNDLPHKFEAGTPAIAQAVGFGAAVDYLEGIGLHAIHEHEAELTRLAMSLLKEIPGLQVIGPEPDQKGGVVSFSIKDIHAHDVAQILDSLGIAVRAGHHCAQPLHTKFNLAATTRASFYLYNTLDEVHQLARGILKAQEIFS